MFELDETQQLVEDAARAWCRAELAPAVAAEIVAQACDGLAFAQGLVDKRGASLAVVHRNIKPANVITVPEEHRSALVDFDLVYDPSAPPSSPSAFAGSASVPTRMLPPPRLVGTSKANPVMSMRSALAVPWAQTPNRRFSKSFCFWSRASYPSSSTNSGTP